LKLNRLNIITVPAFMNKPGAVFSIYWTMVFIVYLPAAKAGLVGDFPYYIESYRENDFWNFINPKNATALYQTCELHLYILIKLLGTNPFLWHLVFVTLHAVNGFLIFLFFGRLLSDSQIKNALPLSFIAVCFFLISPHASEVVVWKACSHYLFAIAVIFLILVFVQKFHKTQKAQYAFITAFLFFYSSFSHEFFYLIPWFILILIYYYHLVLGSDKIVFKKSLLYFFVPTLLLFCVHLLLLRIFKHTYVSHFGKLEQLPLTYYLDKPLKYFFHVLFFGRYFSLEARNKIYALCETKNTLLSFYSVFLCFWFYVLFRIRKVSMKLKALALSSIYLMVIFLFLSPVFFADTMLVCYDRYLYPSIGFASLFFVLLVSFIPVYNIRIVLFVSYALINIWLTGKVNVYWKQSAYVVKRLLNDVPDAGNKTVLLLNLPDDLQGIPMISAQEEGRFKIMKNLLTTSQLNNTAYDVVAYKMTTINDGAHVKVINDSEVNVTLNQWGTWWLYGMLGANNYENNDYKVNMVDEGHWYELTLKHPPEQYMLLYQAGSQWKEVDWGKKNTDQY